MIIATAVPRRQSRRCFSNHSILLRRRSCWQRKDRAICYMRVSHAGNGALTTCRVKRRQDREYLDGMPGSGGVMILPEMLQAIVKAGRPVMNSGWRRCRYYLGLAAPVLPSAAPCRTGDS